MKKRTKMKYFKSTAALLVLSLSLCFTGQAQEAKRSIQKNFPLTSNGKLSIDNRYGSVKLSPWNKQEVQLVVNIKVDAGKLDRSEEVLEEIEIEIDATPNAISAVTHIGDQNRNWWSNWGIFRGGNINYSIDYVVQLPQSASMDIKNAYGDIFIDVTDGPAVLDCSYGSIEVGELNHPDNDIDIRYAPNSHIDFIQGGKLMADYSGLTIHKAGKLSYDADYSKSEFDEIEQLDFEADYGRLTVGKVGALRGDADYLSIKIGQVRKILKINMDYGGIQVRNIQPTTESVRLTTDYTGITLEADPNWEFQFEVETEYANFKSDFPLDYRKKVIESTDRYYSGTHLSDKNSLSISADYGSVKLYKH